MSEFNDPTLKAPFFFGELVTIVDRCRVERLGSIVEQMTYRRIGDVGVVLGLPAEWVSGSGERFMAYPVHFSGEVSHVDQDILRRVPPQKAPPEKIVESETTEA